MRLHKAWWLLVAMIGSDPAGAITIPAYARWDIKKLKRQIDDLQHDVRQAGKVAMLDSGRLLDRNTLEWLADSFDRWIGSGCGVFSLGTVRSVEAAIGKLAFRRTIDCPPYAEVVLQGLMAGAVRHPEYHLGVDLALFYNLFMELEGEIEARLAQMQLANGEPSQSLGRAVILTCFNLLEAFTSGLATGFLIENANVAPEVHKKLEDKGSLRKRFKTFPGIVSGTGRVLEDDVDPLKSLFGDCKQRRDSFVHCEPGMNPGGYGYVKEKHFHDITASVVRRTVDLTEESICLAWAEAGGRKRPTWLQTRGADGLYPKVGATISLSQPA